MAPATDIIDAIDILCEAKELTEAALMAAEGMQSKSQRNGMARLIGTVADRITDVQDMLNALNALNPEPIRPSKESQPLQRRHITEQLFKDMSVRELHDAARAILAAHHSFDQQGCLYSGLGEEWDRMQTWSDALCDLMVEDIRAVRQELAARSLTLPSDIEMRNNAFAWSDYIAGSDGMGDGQ